MPFLTFSPSQFSASGSSSPTTAWLAREFSFLRIVVISFVLTWINRSPSVEGFWAHGFGGEGQGSIRVGDDDEGA